MWIKCQSLKNVYFLLYLFLKKDNLTTGYQLEQSSMYVNQEHCQKSF